MPDTKPRPGTFLPYLEFEQRNMRQFQETQSASPMTLLEILERQSNGALALVDLFRFSGMSSEQYRDALRILRDGGYVLIEGDQLDELIKATDKGLDAAALAHPA